MYYVQFGVIHFGVQSQCCHNVKTFAASFAPFAKYKHPALARHYSDSDCKKCISIYTVYIDIHSL